MYYLYVNISTFILMLLTWRIWWALNNASRWRMGFNLAFKGLNVAETCALQVCRISQILQTNPLYQIFLKNLAIRLW